MNENRLSNERGQSLVLVAGALVALVIFVAITVDVSSAYYHRRTAQNAADGAALAGASRLATGINNEKKLDNQIQEDMNDFAELNGIADTAPPLADADNENVDGWYLDTQANRIVVDGVDVMVGSGAVPDGAYGIEAITYITAPTYFGGILGFHGYPLQARAVSQVKLACGDECLVPITTDVDFLLDEHDEPMLNECFNVWFEREKPDGTLPLGVLGWVNWSWQWSMCTSEEYGDGRPCPLPQGTNGCDTPVLGQNLDPVNCASGFVKVGDWLSAASGAMSAEEVKCHLSYYLGIPGADNTVPLDCSDGEPHSFTIPVYGQSTVDVLPDEKPVPCNSMSEPYDPYYWFENDLNYNDGLHYQVVGFARMQLLGYSLSAGTPVPAETIFDPASCITHGTEDGEAFRISARFLEYVTDYTSTNECYDPMGTLWSSPRLTE